MPKKILVLYYSQTGQLKDIVNNIAKPFEQLKDSYTVTYYEIKMEKDFPFPWQSEVFYDTFPETYRQISRAILPPPEEVLNQKFDLILFGYQVWFLTPSIPIISFLKSAYAPQIMANTPVITISATRNMWMLSQEKLKIHLQRLQAKLVGNIALVDRHDNYTSVITILNWMQTGNKEQKKPFPKAGVSDAEIASADKYGTIIEKYVSQDNYNGLQNELVKNGAVEIRPFLIKVETVGNKLFTVFSGIILKKPEKRKFWVGVYKFYLMAAIWVISPIVLIIYNITTPIFWWKRKKQIQYYQGL